MMEDTDRKMILDSSEERKKAQYFSHVRLEF